MSKKKDVYLLLRILVVVVLVAFPFLASGIYHAITAPRPSVRFAGGLEGGRYDEFAKSLVNELNESSQLNRSTSLQSGGSYENLKLLEDQKVEFALFQSGSDQKEDLMVEHKEILFVTNVFPEVAHVLVRSDITQEQIDNLDFYKIAVGVTTSGDYRVGMALLSHFKLDGPEVEVRSMDYQETVDAMNSRQVEMAILNVGIGAEVVQTLMDDVQCRLIPVPMRDAFLAKHVAYASYTIPRGTYFSGGDRSPAEDIETIAVNAQLITRQGVSSQVVHEILQTLNHARFLKQNQLRDLFLGGRSYALTRPEFNIHPAVPRYFDPTIRPWINPDFVEATEGIRSFVFSGLIGLYLLIHWLKKRNERSQEHKLDHFIHRLLAIEQEQLALDRNYSDEDIQKLEQFLDEITELRREALIEFSAHQLNDDPAIECFISMSHALSEKINSKMTRDAIRRLKD